jgi:hypothetical protein
LRELVKSQTAERKQIDNTPDDRIIDNLKQTTRRILQPVRDYYKIPFSPSSGYRSAALSLAVGSSTSSQHCAGRAVDFEVPTIDNFALATWVADNLEFDQLILECYRLGEPYSGWVHVSWVPDERRYQSLTYVIGSGYSYGLNQ